MSSTPSDAIVWEALNELWALPFGSRYCPVPLPVSLTREALRRMKRGRMGNFLCSAKTDGVRHMLLLSQDEDTGESFAALVSRKGEITSSWAVSPDRDSSLFDGTLVDGELCADGMFVVFDVLALRGYDYKKKPFVERLRDLHKSLPSIRDAVTGTLRVAEKSWLPLGNGRALMKEARSKSDGVILAQCRAPYGRNRCRDLFKWKAVHTVDLRVESRSELLAQTDSGEETKYPGLAIAEGQTVREEWIGQVCECAIDAKGGGAVRVIGTRPDKSQPNHVSTVERTLSSIEDRITASEV